MASPGRDFDSGFDQILKNTEFENDQQLRAIKVEREKIQAYETQLKEKCSQIVQLEKSISGLDEHAKQLHKQFSINRDNCESLKRTSSVLADHEEALKAKLKTMEREVEAERLQQDVALRKYDSIWDRYRRKYESLEKAQQLKTRETELQTLLRDNASLEMQIVEIKEMLQTLKHQNDDELSLISMVLKIAQLRVKTDRNYQLAHTESKATADLEQEIITLQDDLVKAEKLAQESQKEINDTPPSITDEAMEVDDTSFTALSTPQPVNNEEHFQRRKEVQVTPCNPSATTTILTAHQAHRQSSTTTPPPKAPGSLITSPSSAPTTKQSMPPSRYRIEMPKLCTPSRTSTRSTISGTRPPTTNVTNYSMRLPPPAVTVSFDIRATNTNTSALRNLAASNPTNRPTLPRPVLPLLHTPTQSRPQVSLSIHPTMSTQQPNSNILPADIPAPHFTLSLKQPSTTSSLSPLLRSQPPLIVSQPPPPASTSQTITPMTYTPVNNLFTSRLQTSRVQPTSQQSSSSGSNSTSQTQQPSLPTVAPTQTDTHQSMVTSGVESDAHVQDSSHTLCEQMVPAVGDSSKSLPFQSSAQDNTYEKENSEHCDANDIGNNAGLSSTEHSLFVSETDPSNQLYASYGTEYGSLGDSGCPDYQGAQDGSQGQALFTDGGEAQMYYGLKGHVGGHGNQPDVTAGSESSGFMEGFRFDEESADGGGDGGFSFFGSDNMELSKETGGTSDFSFSFGGSETSNTGSFFF